MADVYSCHAILTTPVAHAFVRKRLCARSQPRGHWINESQSQKGDSCLFPPFSISVWRPLSFSSRSLLPTDTIGRRDVSIFQCYLTNWYRFAERLLGFLRRFNGRRPPMTSDGIKRFASMCSNIDFFRK